jgi:hypothetical protein
MNCNVRRFRFSYGENAVEYCARLVPASADTNLKFMPLPLNFPSLAFFATYELSTYFVRAVSTSPNRIGRRVSNFIQMRVGHSATYWRQQSCSSEGEWTRTNGGSYRRVKNDGGAVLGIGAVNKWFADAGGSAHHGSEAERYGEQSARKFRHGPAGVQRTANAHAASATTAEDATTAANPAEERRIGRPVSTDSALN